MKKITLLLHAVFIVFTTVNSQQLNPSILASQGDISKGAGISLEWTLGEPLVESLSEQNRMFTQGFHQPILKAKIIAVAAAEPATSKILVSVAPNPVQSILTVNIVSPSHEKFILSFADLTGRRLFTKAANGKFSNTQLDVAGMAAGVYLLEIRNTNGRLIQSFKIIKGN